MVIQEFNQEVSENDGQSIILPDGVIEYQKTDNLIILKEARYGKLSEVDCGIMEGGIDVKEIVANHHKNGLRKFYAENKLFGDPAPGEHKQLFIWWIHDSSEGKFTVDEHFWQAIQLPNGLIDHGHTIVNLIEATYGQKDVK